MAKLGLIVGLLVFVSAEERQTAPVSVEGGKIVGVVEGEKDPIEIFRGIPYAAPPVGERRWKPPAAVIPWEGVRTCDSFGPVCPQPDVPIPNFNVGPNRSEDCLYLNVYRPVGDSKNADEKLPVMVWIHGGGYIIGAGSQSMYDAEQLASRGVIVVTCNYRLGPFGFLAHPALSKESPSKASGNYGLMDQIAVLRWVRDNIGHFGGDPSNVTIFGESAGGGSVVCLLLAPQTRGLFQRAIAQSAPRLDFSHLRESRFGYPPAETRGVEMARGWGVEDGPSAAEQLRALPTETVAASSERLTFKDFSFARPMLKLAPIVDGEILPDDPITLFDEGKFAAVPLMIGANRDETTLFLLQGLPVADVEGYAAFARKNLDGFADRFLELYPASDRSQLREALVRSLSDMIFIAPARQVARAVSKKAPVYDYEFAHVPTAGLGRMLGAHHGVEIPFVFGHISALKGSNDQDKGVEALVGNYWTRFAASGDPNGASAPTWPRYDAQGDAYMELSAEPRSGQGLRKLQCDFSDEIVYAWLRREPPNAEAAGN